MQSVNIHEAKTQLSRLLARVAEGESIIISKAGKPIAKLAPLDDAPAVQNQRIGFMEGEFSVPDDFDTMGADTIETLFSDGSQVR